MKMKTHETSLRPEPQWSSGQNPENILEISLILSYSGVKKDITLAQEMISEYREITYLHQDKIDHNENMRSDKIQ